MGHPQVAVKTANKNFVTLSLPKFELLKVAGINNNFQL